MPTTCCVPKCTSQYNPNGNVHFFAFPRDEDRRAAWVAAINRDERKSLKSAKVCNFHFTQTDYMERPGTSRPRLKKSAVPSVFLSDGERLTMCKKEENLPGEQALYVAECTPNISVGYRVIHVADSNSEFSSAEESSCDEENGDMGNTNTNKERQKLKEKKRRLKIKTLHQKLRRQTKRIESLKMLIKTLKKKTGQQEKSIKSMKIIISRLKKQNRLETNSNKQITIDHSY